MPTPVSMPCQHCAKMLSLQPLQPEVACLFSSPKSWLRLDACMPVQATVPVLWLMPALQLLLLLFFTTVAISHWIYSWALLLPCLITGTHSLNASLTHSLTHSMPHPATHPPTCMLTRLQSFRANTLTGMPTCMHKPRTHLCLLHCSFVSAYHLA